MKHHLVLVHTYKNFGFNNSKFAQVTQFKENLRKIQNLKEFERFNQFQSNSIPKIFDWYIILCIFRTIAQILRKWQLPQKFFKKFKIPQNLRLGVNLHENCHDWRVVTASLLYKISTPYLKPFTNYSVFKIRKSSTYIHTHTFGRQLKIIFLDALDHSEYSDDNISNFFFTNFSSVRK